MKTLFILNDPPYGTERCYNALRLAHALLKSTGGVMPGARRSTMDQLSAETIAADSTLVF